MSSHTAVAPKQRRNARTPPQGGLSPTSDELAIATLRQFRQVFNAVRIHFQQTERRTGIGGAQAWALSIVQQQPGIGMGGLAQAMDIHQSTASNLVRGLAERHLIEPRRSQSDGRAVALHITTDGRKLLSKVPGPFSGVLPAALKQLDGARLQRLNKDLAALLQLIGHVDHKAARTPLADM
jgi:DNA-binding MarR family transcriptional regulator